MAFIRGLAKCKWSKRRLSGGGRACRCERRAASMRRRSLDGFWEKALSDPVAFFTFWVGAFTGVLAFPTIGLWIVTEKGVRNQITDHHAYNDAD